MNVHAQMLPDIIIPEIEITDGWLARDVSTIEECDDAFSYLMAAVAEIEFNLELHDIGRSKFTDPVWPANARRALKYKKAALKIVGERRGQINAAANKARLKELEARLLAHIRKQVPDDQFMQWLLAVNGDE